MSVQNDCYSVINKNMKKITEYKKQTSIPDPEKLKKLEQGMEKLQMWAKQYAEKMIDSPEKKQLLDFLKTYENL